MSVNGQVLGVSTVAATGIAAASLTNTANLIINLIAIAGVMALIVSGLLIRKSLRRP